MERNARIRAYVVGLSLVAASVFAALQPAGAAGPINNLARGPAKNEPARGLVFDGLAAGRLEGPCRGALEMQTRKGSVCTHGPDAAPEGVDVRNRRSTRDLAASISVQQAALTSGGVPCYGDGTSGKRVQAVYAHSADVPSRYATLVPFIRQWAAATDQSFSDSAAETGGLRHVRWVTDTSCSLAVQEVQLSPAGDDSFAATENELYALGYGRTDRKYLIWMDANVYCGIADIKNDDRAISTNYNTAGPSYARVDNGCWGMTGPAEGHELMHNLGGVQLSAPHTTGGYHCTDESDLMCYADNSAAKMSYPCPSSHDRLFDCGHDDYFHTSPPAGSYLSSHWNSAMSPYLEIPASASSTTSVFTGKLSRKSLSQSFNINTGSGPLVTTLVFSKTSQMTTTVFASNGSVVGQATGPNPGSLAVSVAAGPTTIQVAAPKAANFSLTVVYPIP